MWRAKYKIILKHSTAVAKMQSFSQTANKCKRFIRHHNLSCAKKYIPINTWFFASKVACSFEGLFHAVSFRIATWNIQLKCSKWFYRRKKELMLHGVAYERMKEATVMPKTSVIVLSTMTHHMIKRYS